MKYKFNIYPFGYIFTEDRIQNPLPHYNEESILNKYYFYHDSRIKYHINIQENNFLLIHGDFIHIGITDEIEINEIPRHLLNLYINDYDEFLNTLDFIAGRFTIILKYKENVIIFPDATNARSNYYATDRILASSHAKYISDLYDYQKTNKSDVLGQILLDTPFLKIKSTIPNHYTNLTNMKVSRFFPRDNNEYRKMPIEKRFELIERFWKRQIQFYSDSYKKIILSITGGLDSRFSLALSKNQINNMNFFTYAYTNKVDESTPSSKMLSKDYVIVKKLLSDIKLNHKFFFFKDNPVTLTKQEDYILSRNTISKHNPKLVKYISDSFGKNSLHLRGNLLEIGQAYLFRRNKLPNNSAQAKESFIKMYKDSIKKNPIALSTSFNQFINEINYFDNTFDYHLLDLIYWELRMGRWICEVSNNHDSAFKTINPFNHRAMIAISLSFSYKQRRDGFMFREIINRNYPLLNFYGINNPSNLYEQLNSIEKINNRNDIFFTKFKARDLKKESIVQTHNNELYLPSSLKLKSQYSEITIPFKKNKGIAHIQLESKYGSKDFKNYIHYCVYKNNELLLKEDISNWSIPNTISIPAMKKSDKVKIRIIINKDLPNEEDWENNSIIKILSYTEVSSNMSNKRKVMFSSPYSMEQ